MKPRSRCRWTGALSALCLTGLATLSQAPATSQTSTPHPRYYSGDDPVSVSEANKLLALQSIVDMKLTTADIIKILPLVKELRAEQNVLHAKYNSIESDLLQTRLGDTPNKTAQDRIRDVNQAVQSHHEDIWASIAKNIGADRAGTLRNLVEPSSAEQMALYAPSVHLQRIEQLIAEWDRLSAQRIARSNGTADTTEPTSTSAASTATESQSSTQTVTYQTTTQPAMSETDNLYRPQPRVTAAELVDLLEGKLQAQKMQRAEWGASAPWMLWGDER